MVTLRYSAAKGWTQFVLVVVASIGIIALLNVLTEHESSRGGLAGLLGVVGIFLFGSIKRTTLKNPIVVVDARGITIGLPKFGTIPWPAIQNAKVAGTPWLTSARLMIDYTGTAPKVGFFEKFFWFLQTKQKGPSGRLTIAGLETTDRPLAELRAALDDRQQRSVGEVRDTIGVVSRVKRAQR